MYESPIDKIIGEMKSQMVKDEESQLMVQVSQTVGYDIDKNELIRALNYDRKQYEKGYVDGLKAASKWIPVSERLPEKNMACYVAVGQFNFTQIAMYSDLMGTIDHRIFYQGDYGHDSFEDITEYVNAWIPLLSSIPEPYKAESEDD